jgi:hypothetical protein
MAPNFKPISPETGPKRATVVAAFLTPTAFLLAARLIKATRRHSIAGNRGVSMFSSLAIAVIVCFLVGTAIVVALAVRAAGGDRSGGSIARVLYDAEHSTRIR